MRSITLARVLVMSLAACAGFGLLLLIIGGAARLGAEALTATPTCDAAGISIDPATTLLSPDLNDSGCLFDGAPGRVPLLVDLPVSQPASLSGELPVPHPGYHHVGTWNSDVVLERATVHSSKLKGVMTRLGECFWRTSHLVSWGTDQVYWVESGLFRCSDDPYVIFVFVNWGLGSPGYVIGPEVAEGATVTTFAEWECIGNTNIVSGGYFNERGDKVYLIRYNTRTSPCVELNQTDNNGEAYTVPSDFTSHSHFLVHEITTLNFNICDKDGRGNWLCRLWDETFSTATVENRDTYDVHWLPSVRGLESGPAKYYDWLGRGHGPLDSADDLDF